MPHASEYRRVSTLVASRTEYPRREPLLQVVKCFPLLDVSLRCACSKLQASPECVRPSVGCQQASGHRFFVFQIREEGIGDPSFQELLVSAPCNTYVPPNLLTSLIMHRGKRTLNNSTLCRSFTAGAASQGLRNYCTRTRSCGKPVLVSPSL
ncbi:hypothetical protein BDY19DRAFT_469028 [Irpex rosettiformis]|uniref:Uncharacterized protein n=1 Tax=Irpex rosettiformis TaxID=378272 RepID=A0ACB8TSJ8_9APHY|nr:hypothetical protein BDY19DRAFT_469028 [Irpex rosettiformis]